MNDPIDEYSAAVRSELAGVPGTDDLVAELEDHLRAAADKLMDGGRTSEDAAREAVDRFGSPALIGRRIRAEHGRPRAHDPAPGRRWPFTVAEILLIGAAVAAAIAIHAHWLPCGGDAITQDEISDACLTRMDTGWAFPFAPEAGERGLLADSSRLVALLMIALAWLSFAIGQLWRPRTRLLVALPVVPILAAAAHTAWLITHPSAEPQWWTGTFSFGLLVDALAMAAFVAIINAPPYGRLHETDQVRLKPVTATYGTYRWRVALLLVAVSAPGFTRIFLEFSIMISISDLNWDTPPHTGYITAAFIGLPALASAFLGLTAWLRSRRGRPVPAEPSEGTQTGPESLTIA